MEFSDAVAVLPGDFYPVRTLGELSKTGYVSSMVSLDLLWILDEYITSNVIATGLVGFVEGDNHYSSSTSTGFSKRYAPSEHPMVSFNVQHLYEKHQEDAKNLIDGFNPEGTGKEKYPFLTIAAYEDFQQRIIFRTCRLYLRSLTEEVRSWRSSLELAEALFKVIYESLRRSPHLDLDFFKFQQVKDMAILLAEDDEVSMRRRSLYRFISLLPNLDQVKPAKLTLVKEIYQVLDEPIRRLPTTAPEHKLAQVLAFPQKSVGRVCSICESDMVLRTNKRTGLSFWGCSTFPKCRHTFAD